MPLFLLLISGFLLRISYFLMISSTCRNTNLLCHYPSFKHVPVCVNSGEFKCTGEMGSQFLVFFFQLRGFLNKSRKSLSYFLTYQEWQLCVKWEAAARRPGSAGGGGGPDPWRPAPTPGPGRAGKRPDGGLHY